MMVMSLLHRVVAESSSPEVGLSHQSQFFHKLQSAVYSRDIYLWVFSVYLLIYLIGADMMVCVVDCRKYHPASGRQAVSLLSQSLGAAHILTLRGDYNREKCLLQLLAIKLSRNVVASPDLSGRGHPGGGGGVKAGGGRRKT